MSCEATCSNSIDLASLLHKIPMCSDQDSFSSINIPKHFVDLTLLIMRLLINKALL